MYRWLNYAPTETTVLGADAVVITPSLCIGPAGLVVGHLSRRVAISFAFHLLGG
ncbi:MAG: hypothetical protein ACI8XM_002934, partial [Haloarculaceae archaeon]